jgi:hypothetical protein
MEQPTYWLDLFIWTTWQEFLDAGASASGFRDRRWKTTKFVKPRDAALRQLIPHGLEESWD